MGMVNSPSSLSCFSASVVFALLAGVSWGSSWEKADSAEWKDSARDEAASGVTASCVVRSWVFSLKTAVASAAGCTTVELATSAIVCGECFQTSDGVFSGCLRRLGKESDSMQQCVTLKEINLSQGL